MMRLAVLAGLLAAGTAIAAPPLTQPEDPQAREAARLTQDGRYDLSVPLLETVLARRPDDPDLLTYLALALRRTGRPADAEARYAQALARDPEHLPAIAYQGVLYLETGRRGMAEANLRRLEALCPFSCPEREDLAREIALRR